MAEDKKPEKNKEGEPVAQKLMPPTPLGPEPRIFAVASTTREWAQEFMENKLFLSLSVAPSYMAAINAARKEVKGRGLDPETFNIGSIIVDMPLGRAIMASGVVQIPILMDPPEEFRKKIEEENRSYIIGKKRTEKPAKVETPPVIDLGRSKERSATELSSYVLYVFDKVGTKAEKDVAQKVIQKFKKEYGGVKKKTN